MNNNSLNKKFLAALLPELWPEDLKKEAESELSNIIRKQSISFKELKHNAYYRPILLGILSSIFVKNSLKRYPDILVSIIEKGPAKRIVEKDKLFHDVRHVLAIKDEEEFLKAIRIFRTTFMVQIAISDISGILPFKDICNAITNLAEVCVETCLKWLEKDMEPKFGRPLSSKGELQRLIVLGMGKLGGGELNFSSDIDLIFSFKETGITKGGAKQITNEEYFLEQARKLIKFLSAQTPDGLVFRVDTRLRPFGDSGPLVVSIDAMEEYYERHGRQWERYAFVKARPIAGDIKGGEELLSILKPFIYKRYLDYSTIESLKEMKTMILAEQAKKTACENVKLGPGGIRDIEFIVQTIQLIKGGRIPSLQTSSFFKALSVIEELLLLDLEVCKILKEAYVFLRTTENRLQEYQAQQAHVLPRDDKRRTILALSLGFNSWKDFHNTYWAYSQKINKIFRALFEEPKDLQAENIPKPDLLLAKLIWASLGEEESLNALIKLGFNKIEELQNLLSAIKYSKKVKSLSGNAQEMLDELLPKLILFSKNEENPDKALKNSIFIIEAVLKRTIYLHLLTQYPKVLEHLIFLCGKSNLIAELLKRQPILLDELIDANILFSKSSKEDMQRRLQGILRALSLDDLELWLDEIRRFKKANVLRIAACQLKGLSSALVVARELSDLAEVILWQVFEKAWDDFILKGPRFFQELSLDLSGLGIIAYGKLGSQEMSYSSDLDLVFLYHPELIKDLSSYEKGGLSYYYARVIQKFISFVTTRTSQGLLYEIDTRLRPNGSQGVLVSSLESFMDYQLKKAWTWEHQALIKARFVCGDKRIEDKFERIRRDIICQKRDEQRLKKEIVEMRNKIISSVKKDSREFHIKKDPGGLVDIEFIVQFLVLKNAWKYDELANFRNTKKLLDIFGELGVIEKDKLKKLTHAYLLYLEKIDLLSLNKEKPTVESKEFFKERNEVKEIFDQVLLP